MFTHKLRGYPLLTRVTRSLWAATATSALICPIIASGQAPSTPADGSPAIARPVAPPEVIRDRWYAVQLQGKRTGWMRELETRNQDRITTSSEMQFRIARGAIKIELSMKTEFVETIDGKPVSMRSEQRLGSIPTVTQYTFTDTGVLITSTQGEQTTTRTAERPAGEWSTPAATRRRLTEELASGKTTLVSRSLDPSSGVEAITTTRTLVERAPVEVLGKAVPGNKLKVSVDKFPGIESTEFVSDSGDLLRTQTSMGVLKLDVLLADEQLAKLPGEAPELLNSLLVVPDRAIAAPRKSERSLLIVSTSTEELTDLPNTGTQVFTRLDRRSAELAISRRPLATAPAADSRDASYTQASAMIDPKDPKVVEWLSSAKSSEWDKLSANLRAERLRRSVHHGITKKSLDVGFASASEVARTRQGDCTEHGVLLAALLRADSIPSRVVSGLIYADSLGGEKGAFGYHMWTQALLPVGPEEGIPQFAWTDFDATLPDDCAYDATHIALSTSSLANEALSNDLVKLAPLIGTLNVEVRQIIHMDALVSTPGDKPAASPVPARGATP